MRRSSSYSKAESKMPQQCVALIVLMFATIFPFARQQLP